MGLVFDPGRSTRARSELSPDFSRWCEVCLVVPIVVQRCCSATKELDHVLRDGGIIGAAQPVLLSDGRILCCSLPLRPAPPV